MKALSCSKKYTDFLCCMSAVLELIHIGVQHWPFFTVIKCPVVFQMSKYFKWQPLLCMLLGMIDCTWVWDPIRIPLHLGLLNRPFEPRVRSWEPRDFAEVMNDPQAYSLNILRLQNWGAQVHVSRGGQSLKFTQCGPRSPLPFHTSYKSDYPLAP